jgi:hypothetical protein
MKDFNVGDTVRYSDYFLRDKKDRALTVTNSRLKLSAEKEYKRCLVLRGTIQKVIPWEVEVRDSEGYLHRSLDYIWEKVEE